MLAHFASYPYGILIRIVPLGEHAPSLAEVVELNRKLFAAFDLDYPRPGHDDDWAAVMHRRYAFTWASIANALDAAGDHQGADAARDVARQLQPARE